MKKKISSISLLILLSLLPFRAQAEQDFQLWTELYYAHKFKPSKFTLHWSMENRFDDNATNHFVFNTSLGFDYGLFEWFKPAFFYRFEKKEGSNAENRLYPMLTFIVPWKPVKIANRNRFEFRFFTDGEFRFRYRNRTKISKHFKSKPVSFTPFIYDEIFIEPEKHGFNENRLRVGNEFGFWKDRIFFGLYYQWQAKQNSTTLGWDDNHVLGTTLGFKY